MTHQQPRIIARLTECLNTLRSPEEEAYQDGVLDGKQALVGALHELGARLVAKDGPRVRALAEREGLDIEPLLELGYDTDSVMLCAPRAPSCNRCLNYWMRRGLCSVMPADDAHQYEDGKGPGKRWSEPTTAPPWCPGFKPRSLDVSDLVRRIEVDE